jgi:hypothetical protein
VAEYPPIDPFGVRSSGFRQMRQSFLGTADTCLKRIEHQLAMPNHYGSSEARVIGTAYHGGMEALYNDAGLDEALAAVKAAFAAEIAKAEPEWDTSREQALELAEQLVYEYWVQELRWPETYKVLGVEQEFWLPGEAWGLGPNWVVKGSIDLILQGPDGWHYIVDHKTAGKPWKKGKHSGRNTNQPAKYVQVWQQLWAWTHDGEVPNVRFFFDIMTLDGQFERREAHPTMNERQLVVQKARDLATIVDRGGPFPPNQSSFLCHHKYCDFWAICPYGESFESGVAETPVLIGAS